MLYFVFQTIATQVRFENHLIQKLVKAAFRVFEQHLFEQRSVHELLWGFNLTLPSYITKFPFLVKVIDDIIRSHNGNSTTFGIYVGVSVGRIYYRTLFAELLIRFCWYKTSAGTDPLRYCEVLTT